MKYQYSHLVKKLKDRFRETGYLRKGDFDSIQECLNLCYADIPDSILEEVILSFRYEKHPMRIVDYNSLVRLDVKYLSKPLISHLLKRGLASYLYYNAAPVPEKFLLKFVNLLRDVKVFNKDLVETLIGRYPDYINLKMVLL